LAAVCDNYEQWKVLQSCIDHCPWCGIVLLMPALFKRCEMLHLLFKCFAWICNSCFAFLQWRRPWKSALLNCQ
jgi:hypothetical protein